MLETTVLTFRVLTDDAEINVLVACLVTGNVLEKDNVGVNVEFLTEGNVERDMTRARYGCVEDTCFCSLV